MIGYDKVLVTKTTIDFDGDIAELSSSVVCACQKVN